MPFGDTKCAGLAPEKIDGMLSRSQRLETLGRMTGAIAHDFNNLLLVVLGATELARLATRDPRVEVELSRIEEASIRAAGLVRQLLGFARGKPAEPRVVRVGEIVSQLARLLELALGNAIAFDLDVTDGLWPVVADPGQIEQVFLNLAINARDAMPTGGRLHISVCNLALVGNDGLPGDDYVVARLRDSGVGMEEATLARVFEPFFSTKAAGTGLGLATCKRIVERAGGTIRAESRVGVGTTFEIRLPRATVA